MNDEAWIEQYKQWNTGLQPFEIKLLDEGAQSQSQQWLRNKMWCEWNELKKNKDTKLHLHNKLIQDPWDDEVAC